MCDFVHTGGVGEVPSMVGGAAGYMVGMTHIDAETTARREAARQESGQFGEHARTTPEVDLTPREVTVSVATKVNLRTITPVAYPDDIPAGGKVSLDMDDSSNRVYASIDFPDGSHAAVGYLTDGDAWVSLDPEDDHDIDEETVDAINTFLTRVRDNADSAAEAVKYAAFDQARQALTDSVLGVPADHSAETSAADVVARGEKLVNVFGAAAADEEERAADAIADIVAYARTRGIDVDGLFDRARLYSEED